MNTPTLHAFDFDGTLTTGDSLLPFIRHARGRWRLAGALVRFAPRLLLMTVGLCSRDNTKQRLFAHCFGGMLERDFQAHCATFAARYADRLRTPALRFMEQALLRGERVVVVSASVDRWVRPCLEQFLGATPLFDVIATQVDVANGRLTGRFSTPNCRANEKVRRLEAWLQEQHLDRSALHVVAYGDSRSDRPLLAYADAAHYKPFR